jgi:hypothetical protein
MATSEELLAASNDPSTPSPFPAQPGICGHCGNADTEMQGHCVFCFHCGKTSNFDGTPIIGNAHFRANYSSTLPEANVHGMPVSPGSSQIV